MRSGALWAFGSDLYSYPPLEGEGRLTLSGAKCETGRGDLSTRALFERRDCHPAPPLISFASTPPGEGAHQLPPRCASLNLSAQPPKAARRRLGAPWGARAR